MKESDKIINTNFKDAFSEAVADAMDKIFKDKTDAQKEMWLREHADDVRSEVESFVMEAIYRVANPKPNPTGPVLHFPRPDGGEINLWVYDAGQPCSVGEHRQFHFGNSHTGGLVYQEKGPFGHNATEYNLDNASTWEWIQKFMLAGMKAEGLLEKEKK